MLKAFHSFPFLFYPFLGGYVLKIKKAVIGSCVVYAFVDNFMEKRLNIEHQKFVFAYIGNG